MGLTRLDGVIALAGLAVLSIGASLYSPPAGLVTFGAGLIAGAVIPSRGR